jgi:hypothetical protein
MNDPSKHWSAGTRSFVIGFLGALLGGGVVAAVMLIPDRPSSVPPSHQSASANKTEESKSGNDAPVAESARRSPNMPAPSPEASRPANPSGSAPTTADNSSEATRQTSIANPTEQKMSTVVTSPVVTQSAFSVAERLRTASAGALIIDSSSIDGALSVALECIDEHVKKGYILSEDTWGGFLPSGEARAVANQLFKGNLYRFCVGSKVKGARLALHVYDAEGRSVESVAAPDQPPPGIGSVVSVSIKPDHTGSYFLIVKMENSPEERTAWGMAYAYR